MNVAAETTWLLGAGASKDAGAPLASELFDSLKGATGARDLNATYDYIAAGAIMKTARLSLLGSWRRPNVEDVANTLDGLIERDSSDLGPFVGAWQAWLDDMDPTGEPRPSVTEAIGASLQRMMTARVTDSVDAGYVDWTAEAKVLVAALHQPRYPGNALLRLRHWLSQAVSERVAGPYQDLSYLEPLARSRVGDSSVCAGATLNYDTCVERAFETIGVPTCDALVHWRSREVMDVEHSVAHIYKPHGSVLWRTLDDDTYSPAAGQASGEPGIIFGGRNKLTARGPFLDSLLAWRSALESCRKLLVVGYSFGDDHVNALIANWYRRQQGSKRIIIVDPGFSKASNGFADLLHRRSNEAQDPDTDEKGRLILPGLGSVRIIREPASAGIALAISEFERA